MTPASPVLRLSPVSVGVVLWLVGALTGCSQKDAEKCNDAQKVARQAIESRDFDAARKWREYAYKQCADASALAGLDRDLVDREAAVKAEVEGAAKRKAETASLVRLFAEFAGANRAAPDRAAAAPVCDPPAVPPPPGKAAVESKDRFCAATRTTGAYTITTRYWDADHTAFRFTTTPAEPVDCAALGGTVAKTWGVPAAGGKTAQRFRCTLSGPLTGLSAVVTGAAKADMHIFSPGYVERDPGARPLLEGP